MHLFKNYGSWGGQDQITWAFGQYFWEDLEMLPQWVLDTNKDLMGHFGIGLKKKKKKLSFSTMVILIRGGLAYIWMETVLLLYGIKRQGAGPAEKNVQSLKKTTNRKRNARWKNYPVSKNECLDKLYLFYGDMY